MQISGSQETEANISGTKRRGGVRSRGEMARGGWGPAFRNRKSRSEEGQGFDTIAAE